MKTMKLLTGNSELNCLTLLFTINQFLLFMNFRQSEATHFNNDTDRLALISFKNHINNDPYHAFASWNDTTHFCDWQGVSCSHRHQRVTALDLSNLGLLGTITPHIVNLTFLHLINLSNNSFHGQIPNETSRLYRLQRLLLYENLITGEIPANITQFSELRELDLSYNNLTGVIPAELGSSSRLENLSLGFNNLVGSIPLSLGNLSFLAILYLSGNNLEGTIPGEFGQLKSLEVLDIYRNELSGAIPPTLYNISTLKVLDLGTNQLTGRLSKETGTSLHNLQRFYVGRNRLSGLVPITLSNASNLELLDLPDNYFSGPVPMNLGSLQNLTILNFSRNKISADTIHGLSFLTALTNCTALELLDLTFNLLQGVLPNSIANFSTQLDTLAIGGNQITGSIPSGIENLKGLTALILFTNFFSGNIIPEIGNLRNLQWLDLSENKFYGEIPSSIGNITKLLKLYLDGNELQGRIPLSLGNCKTLLVLTLSGNKLNGTIPEEIFSLSSLSIALYLDSNYLIGGLPYEVGSLNNLQSLDISENMLSGEIPSNIGKCITLAYLNMAGNNFEGPIPFPLGDLKSLEELDLSRNTLSGQIPKYLEKFPFLQKLNLSFNHFEGEVPKEGIFQNISAASILGNKNLCGGIPKLQLPACLVPSYGKKRRSPPLKVVIFLISMGFLFILSSCFIVICYRRRKPTKKPTKKPSSTCFLDESCERISYQDLFKATAGFSPSNLIGVGSFGSVYKGFLDNKEVAVKVLDLRQQGAYKSFMAECEALRNTRHRNLVKILTSCSTVDFKGNDFKALVFEFMSNGSLEKWLHEEIDGQEQSKLNLIQRLNIAVDVASALDYLHNHCHEPIVHCDLKPSNVLLDDEMSAHVGDFGLARFLSPTATSSTNQTSTLGLKGSIGYIAPEYGMGGEVSTCGDIYSYGILLLEMFTGKRPTDSLFVDSLNISEFVRRVFPERVLEIGDPVLLLEEDEATSTKNRSVRRKIPRKCIIQECLVSVIKIGLLCSMESSKERMGIRDALIEMQAIRENYFDSI